jgi:translation initiation factor IF-3
LRKRYSKKRYFKEPLVNEKIRAHQVRLIDEKGVQIGVIDTQKALKEARERSLDLVQVTKKVDPPVCKILDYGKYLYRQRKKEKAEKTKAGEIKGIRLSFGISDHDLETRVKQTEKFLKKGYKVRIVMNLRGRQKGLTDFAKSKIEKFLELLKQKVPVKIEMELKKQPRGLTMIISKS